MPVPASLPRSLPRSTLPQPLVAPASVAAVPPSLVDGPPSLGVLIAVPASEEPMGVVVVAPESGLPIPMAESGGMGIRPSSQARRRKDAAQE